MLVEKDMEGEEWKSETHEKSKESALVKAANVSNRCFRTMINRSLISFIKGTRIGSSIFRTPGRRLIRWQPDFTGLSAASISTCFSFFVHQ